MNAQVLGHAIACFTMLVWGTTFISTKVLLETFSPLDILILRFLLGALALTFIMPRRLPFLGLKHELTLVAAGLCGVTLYFLLENTALTFTQAANVGIILGSAPMFCALVERFFGSKAPLPRGFVAGFICAMSGIALLSVNSLEVDINPLGDGLAVAASAIWGFYSLAVRKAASFGYPMPLITRRIFVYGLIGMVPFTWIFDCGFDPAVLLEPANWGNLLFLGLGASALCFFTWNYALELIGTMQASPYLYAAPVVTVVAAMIFLQERLTLQASFGMGLTMLGLLLSQRTQVKQVIRHFWPTKEKGR